MKLYKLESSNFEAFFGAPEEPVERDVITIAQTPTCDAFLYLSNETYDELELLDSVPTGFDFTYCQEWGLTVDDDVVDRVILDLRKKLKNNLPMAHGKGLIEKWSHLRPEAISPDEYVQIFKMIYFG